MFRIYYHVTIMTAIILPDTVSGIKIPVHCCVFMVFVIARKRIVSMCIFSRFNATTDFVHHVYISLWLIPCYIYVDVQRMLNSYSVVILADFIVYSLFHCCKNRTYSATCLCRCSISAYLNTRTVKKGIIYLPIWREKTWKSGHVTVLDFLVSTQRCKISDTRIFSPI